jgi:glycosyltransferase involved in cell wall biosynthesis
LGHQVVLIDMWQKNEWHSFDVLHFYGFSLYMRDFIIGISKINPNIIVSPILDPNFSINRLKLYVNWGSKKLNLTNRYHGLFSIKNKIKIILIRSEFEKKYMVDGFGFRNEICRVVPISFNLPKKTKNFKKEPFCLHVSLLADERKNVKRLIQAAIKYNFKLIFAGKLRNEQELKLLNSWIKNHENIEYRGFLSNEELTDLYAKAKVFALPSINEGVGIVALEAAYMGCDIVMTNLGGPKEYYNGLAKIINPYCIDEIGSAVVDLLNGETFQPQLSDHIKNQFLLHKISLRLIECYNSVIRK